MDNKQIEAYLNDIDGNGADTEDAEKLKLSTDSEDSEYECSLDEETDEYDDDICDDDVCDDNEIEENAVSENTWSKEPKEPPNFEFNGQPGLKVPQQNLSPEYLIDLFFTEEFIKMVVLETNRYATQEISKKGTLTRSSRFNAWKDTNSNEMRVFIGLYLHMGPVSLPSIEHYWMESPMYNLPFWKKYMARNRFQILVRFLHFANNAETTNDRLYKINPVLQHFNRTMDTIYSPKRSLSIDESMVLWRGRLLFRQYIKNKRHKYGVKLYELCESGGTVPRIQIYAGKNSQTANFGIGLSANVVISLMEGFLDKGYILYTDNFYNSVSLTNYMTTRSTYICGTLRFDRKENPKALIKQKLKKGECEWMRLNSVVVCKWKDKREVLTISNMHKIEMVEVKNKRGDIAKKPNTVKNYNDGMPGTDRSDQMLSYYSALRKTIRWYKKIGLHIFEIFMQNAYNLYSEQNNMPKMSSLKFREACVKYLVDPMSTLVEPITRKEVEKEPTHYIDRIPPTPKKEHPTRRCHVCSKAGKRKESRYYCPGCPQKWAFCMENCFKDYHKI